MKKITYWLFLLIFTISLTSLEAQEKRQTTAQEQEIEAKLQTLFGLEKEVFERRVNISAQQQSPKALKMSSNSLQRSTEIQSSHVQSGFNLQGDLSCSQEQVSNNFENGLFIEAGGQKVADDFCATCPDLPRPIVITLPLQSSIVLHAFSNSEPILPDSLFSARASAFRTFLAIDTLKEQDSIKTILIFDLESQVRNYEMLSKQDSLILNYRLQQVKLLNEQIKLYDNRLKQVDKWYNKPWVGVVGGVITTLITIHVIDYSLPK